MTRHVHEVEVRVANKLDLWCLEESVVILADESGILNGLFGQVPYIRLGADDTDVGWIPMMTLICEGNVLTNEHSNTDTGHVEAIEEGLYVVVNLHALPFPLVLEDTLRHGRDDTIVSSLDCLEGLREPLVVGLQVRRPVVGVIHHGKVSPRGLLFSAGAAATAVLE